MAGKEFKSQWTHFPFSRRAFTCIKIPHYAQANVTPYHVKGFVLKGSQTMFLNIIDHISFEIEWTPVLLIPSAILASIRYHSGCKKTSAATGLQQTHDLILTMVFKHLSYAGGWEETSLCILVLAITIPFPNFNGYSIYFWEWMLNFSPCNFLSKSGLKLIHVSEKGPWSIPWSGNDWRQV